MVNTVARIIISLGAMDRLPAGHSAAGVLAMRNLATSHCAHVIHVPFAADGTSFQTRMRKWIAKVYGVRYWDIIQAPSSIAVAVPPILLPGSFCDFEPEQSWTVSTQGQPPMEA